MKQTEFCRRLGLEAPIFLAPMASVTTPAMVAAVSGAGGLGGHGCAAFAADALQAEITALRTLTDRPVNLNFFVHAPPVADPRREAALRDRLQPLFDEFGLGDVPAARDVLPPFDRAQLETLMADPPAVVSFHFGLPADALWKPLQDKGVVILSSATTVAEARWLADRGVDAVIAQGAEAGGHRGTFLSKDWDAAMIGTMALVPQVVDAVNVPVIAAGGIADGRGIAAALALGAQAAQMGTAFLATAEAATDTTYRQALADARGEDTAVTRTFSGRPARAIRNRYVETIGAIEREMPDFPLPYFMNGALRAAGAKQGMADLPAFWSGQAATLIREGAAADLVAALVAETEAATASLA